eukprot:GFUD01006987.1.p1 GENE.GFUD01006987.1~~GFUD01006987.1.p1  ORF type:complete len:849 (+),score=138.35 GFUD01006987.1:58-2604(+)
MILFVLVLALGQVQNVWMGNETKATDETYLEPIVVHNATLNTTYSSIVNHTTEFLYDFEYTQEEVGDGALRVFVVSDEAETEFPVIVVVRHEKGVLSWQLPMLIQEGADDYELRTEYTAVNRTLCPLTNYYGRFTSKNNPGGLLPSVFEEDSDRNVTDTNKHRVALSISTASPKNVHFSVILYIEEKYYVQMNQTNTILVSPSAPQYYHFDFPSDVDTAIISVTSPDEFCMTMSIQNITCPVYDLDRNVNFEGSYQTVDKKTGMSIRRDQYPHGLHIVFVVKPTDIDCRNSYMDLTPLVPALNCHGPCRNKSVEFTISKKITKNDYLVATFGAFGMFMGAYLLVVLVSCIICVRIRKVPVERSLYDVPPVSNVRRSSSQRRYATSRGYGSIQDSSHVDSVDSIERLDNSDDSSIDEDDIDMLTDADVDKDVFRTKTMLFVSDLARKSPRVLTKKSQLYQWNLITIAIFYGLPVVQLVVTYQQVLNQTGNEDLCYYNFLCAHPLGLLSDFNHVYSNIGYVMLGGLFMIFVWRREYMYRQLVEANPQIDRLYGIPQHYGMFYAMGFALIMEGLMSGSYHICPNHSNFQFDTAFMYTIAILCMLKIYQFRHPDINANAYTAFGVLAFVIFIGVLGVVNGSVTFWIGFTGLYVVSCFVLSIQIYYMGRWKVDSGLIKRVWLMFSHDVKSCFSGAWRSMKPMYPDRMVLLILFNIINWIMAAFGIVKLAPEGGDFASFLLGVFIINLLLYTSFYILMKLRYGEKITKQPAVYILLSWVSWGGAMYFFLNKSTSWVLSPAASRHLNSECKLFHFYDNHDIWHFLSATSLFLSFMILLTLDDDLAEKPRERIPVF